MMLLSLVIQSRKWRCREPGAPEFVAWQPVILSGIVALGVECVVVVVVDDVELLLLQTRRGHVYSVRDKEKV